MKTPLKTTIAVIVALLTTALVPEAQAMDKVTKARISRSPHKVISDREFLFIGVDPLEISKEDSDDSIKTRLTWTIEEVGRCYNGHRWSFRNRSKVHVYRTDYFIKQTPGYVITALGPFTLIDAENVLYKMQDCLGDFMIPLLRKTARVYALTPKKLRRSGT